MNELEINAFIRNNSPKENEKNGTNSYTKLLERKMGKN
jgi:hypothetical protein